jgi:hypothetical protein
MVVVVVVVVVVVMVVVVMVVVVMVVVMVVVVMVVVEGGREGQIAMVRREVKSKQKTPTSATGDRN